MEDFSKYSDEELIQLSIEDENFFVEIVKRYYKQIYNFAFRFANNREDSEEIVQESFLKLWKNLKKFDKSKKFKTWFYSIVKNSAIDFLRKRRNLKFSDFDDEDGKNFFEENLSSEDETVIEEIERIENKNQITDALEKLNSKYKEVLFLRYNEEMSFADISESLKKPLNTVKSLHRRGLALLKEIVSNMHLNR